MKKYKNYLIFLFGTLLFAFGISLGNRSLFGGNSMSILVVGISKHLPLTIGTCNLIVSLIEVLFGYILDKKNVTWVTLVSTFIASYLIDFANIFVIETNNIVIRIIYMLVGVILYCLGLGIEQYANIGYESFDVFIFGFKKAFKVDKYHVIKWFVDGAFIAIGFMLGAEVGVGTLLLLIFAGLLIEKSKELSKRIFK